MLQEMIQKRMKNRNISFFEACKQLDINPDELKEKADCSETARI